LKNILYADSGISSVPHSNQQVSLRERESLSSGKLSAMLQATLETSLIVAGLLLITMQLPHVAGNDGIIRYRELLLFLANHTLLQPHNAKYSLIGPLFSIPLWLVGSLFDHPYEWTCFYNVTLFALSLLISYVLLRNYVDPSLLRKFFLVLIYSSMFAAHLTLYYGEVFTALCVGLGVFVTFRRFTRIGGWIAVVLGVVNTPATLIGLGLLVLKRMLDGKRLRYLLVLAAAALCICMENWLRRGSIFNTGYIGDHGMKTIMPYSGQQGFSYPFFFGLLSILFSFGDGLLFYVPALLLPIRKTLSRWPQDQKIDLYQVYTLWMCFVLGLIIVYSCWWDWSGAVFWGPRYFLFASIPASFALAVRLMRYKEASLGVNLLTFVAFCLSAWGCVDGAVFQWFVTFYPTCMMHNFAWDFLCWYTPEYSALWMPFVFHLKIGAALEKFLIFFLLVAAYMVAPLFIHLLKQIWGCAEQYCSEHLHWRQWRF
jgi:hypothetical protein